MMYGLLLFALLALVIYILLGSPGPWDEEE